MACSLGLMVVGLVARLSVDSHPVWPIFGDSGSLLVACTSLSQDEFQRGGFWEVVEHVASPLTFPKLLRLVVAF